MSHSFFSVVALDNVVPYRDRLYGMLDIKIKDWSKREKENRGGLFGRGANKLELHELLVERLVVAYDLAAAFWYMHQNK